MPESVWIRTSSASWLTVGDRLIEAAGLAAETICFDLCYAHVKSARPLADGQAAFHEMA